MRSYRRRKQRKRIHMLSARQVVDTVKKNKTRILFVLTVAGLIAFVSVNMNSFIFASKYFNISEIEVVDKAADKIDYPLARIVDNPNIFKVDLNQIAEGIERDYHYIQKAIVKRVLPNKLVIEILRRTPIAQMAVAVNRDANAKQYYFTVNKDGYVLANVGTSPKKGLPVIYGTGLSVNTIEIGSMYSKSNLGCALSFLAILQESAFMPRYAVTKIDVAEPRSMSFFINDTLEVKIGNRKWKEKIENLAGMLQNKSIDYSQDYYIDLRFKDFVFGKKDDKK
ncbi:MAG: cell division protein FtsQ/DivIB [Candidatus Omnitrophica bacterium]|nr:cell division protein FtsQ/DivIB [Candidatus Omnitrophota bacterium]MBU4477997.1 cell division protein FtsQ/DivIB [Candidatus Omnitrophota bacterium]MCG2703930.1 cell division protein FtsQ/DivIB [Candidatus Omnitrophota bacterium]